MISASIFAVVSRCLDRQHVFLLNGASPLSRPHGGILFPSAPPRLPFGKLFVDGGSFKVQVTEDRTDTYAKYVDKTMIMGIRPEEIQVRGVVVGQGNAMFAMIEHLEFLGSFCRAELRLTCGRRLLADFSINAMRDLALVPGQELCVALPPDRIRLFADQGMSAHG